MLSASLIETFPSFFRYTNGVFNLVLYELYRNVPNDLGITRNVPVDQYGLLQTLLTMHLLYISQINTDAKRSSVLECIVVQWLIGIIHHGEPNELFLVPPSAQ